MQVDATQPVAADATAAAAAAEQPAGQQEQLQAQQSVGPLHHLPPQGSQGVHAITQQQSDQQQQDQAQADAAAATAQPADQQQQQQPGDGKPPLPPPQQQQQPQTPRGLTTLDSSQQQQQQQQPQGQDPCGAAGGAAAAAFPVSVREPDVPASIKQLLEGHLEFLGSTGQLSVKDMMGPLREYAQVSFELKQVDVYLVYVAFVGTGQYKMMRPMQDCALVNSDQLA
jgi:hypothetical protein